MMQLPAHAGKSPPAQWGEWYIFGFADMVIKGPLVFKKPEILSVSWSMANCIGQSSPIWPPKDENKV